MNLSLLLQQFASFGMNAERVASTSKLPNSPSVSERPTVISVYSEDAEGEEDPGDAEVIDLTVRAPEISSSSSLTVP